MQTHDFLAECDACGEITFWRKANRRSDDGGAVERGYRCVECENFGAVVEDTRGRTHTRD